jgi:hypothetical protein
MSVLDICISFNCALFSVLCSVIYQREVLAVDLIQFGALLDVLWIGSFGMPSHHYPLEMKSVPAALDIKVYLPLNIIVVKVFFSIQSTLPGTEVTPPIGHEESGIF